MCLVQDIHAFRAEIIGHCCIVDVWSKSNVAANSLKNVDQRDPFTSGTEYGLQAI